MGVLFDYFCADSDQTAATVIDRLAGPGGAAAPAKHPKKRWFGRSPPAPAIDAQPGFDTVSLKGIDPVVQMGTLEAILTGTPYEDVTKDARSGNVLADRDGGERLVVTLTESVQAALTRLDGDRIREVAAEWGHTDEFQMGPPWEAKDLERALSELAGLARRSAAAGQQLYCWVCV